MSDAVAEIRASRNALEIELRKAGCTIKGKSCTCPFHEDKHPSAAIHECPDGHWILKCFTPACGFSGDVFDVRARLEGREVGELLREASGVANPEPAEKPKRIFASVEDIRASVSHLGRIQAVYTYCNPDAGATEIVQVRYWSDEEQRKKFLVHHAVDGGFVLGAPPKPWPIYNRTRVRAAETVVLVEGEKCVHSLANIGVVATTSLSGAGNADKADWSPLAGKTVYCWRDNDESGEKYIRTAIAKLENLHPRPTIYCMDVTTLGLDEGGDVDDFLMAPGAAAEFWDVLRDGSELVGAGTEVATRINDIISGKWSSLPWPWPKLSQYAKALFPGTITILCGDPSATKSFFLLQAAEWWNRNQIRVALMELELGRATHLHRMLAMLSNRWDILDDDWGKKNQSELRQLYEAHRAEIDALSPCVFDRPLGRVAYPHIIAWIKERCQAGAQIIAIDPITAVDAGESRYTDDHKFIADASEIVTDHDARLILVTHPRGGTKGKTGQDDLAGGRAFSRHTQAVLWLSRIEPAKALYCRTDLGSTPIECNRLLYIAKSTHGRGAGRKLGFTFGSDAQFAEQGIVMKKKDEVMP